MSDEENPAMDPPPHSFSYDTSEEWADVSPLAQDDGPAPLAQIAYTPQYSTAMSYLRAAMAADEHSFRVLRLTADVINMNPAHYTVWGYRFKCLKALLGDAKDGKVVAEVKVETSGSEDGEPRGGELKKLEWGWRDELEWVHGIAQIYEKNYQIWHFRQQIIDLLDDPNGEQEAMHDMFESDSKNYHVWSYRQWYVRRFELFNEDELAYTDRLITDDVRNNSAWNHRFFVVFRNDRETKETFKITEEVKDREIAYAKSKVPKSAQNPSVWNYLKGVLNWTNSPLTELKSFCEECAPISDPPSIKSSHALDILAEVYDLEDEPAKAVKALDLLATKFDPIRKNYWNYRKRLLRETPGAGASGSIPQSTAAAVEVQASA